MKNCQMKPVDSATEAQWLLTAIEKPWSRSPDANYAAAVVPCGFVKYLRLLHPAYLSDNQEISWSEVAKQTGRTPHSQMQWHRIINCRDSGQSSHDLTAPQIGYLPERQATVLVEILSKHTRTPEECFFAIWDGWGYSQLDKFENQTASFQLWERRYYLATGSISAYLAGVSVGMPPSIWWPRDRSWCAATDIDLMWTYVGGTKSCIDAVIVDGRLEVWEAVLDDRIDIHGDDINID